MKKDKISMNRRAAINATPNADARLEEGPIKRI
jgi:hypothetical protein